MLQVSAETWASQTRQFLASRTRGELLGSGVLGVRGRARSCALLGPGPPTLYGCCVLGTRAGAACVFNFTSLHHPSLQLIYASSQGEAYRSRACSRLDASQARATKGRQRANTAAR